MNFYQYYKNWIESIGSIEKIENRPQIWSDYSILTEKKTSDETIKLINLTVSL